MYYFFVPEVGAVERLFRLAFGIFFLHCGCPPLDAVGSVVVDGARLSQVRAVDNIGNGADVVGHDIAENGEPHHIIV